MDTAAIIAAIATVIQKAVELGPTVITTVEDAVPFGEAIYNQIFGKSEITQADLDALDAQTDTIVQEALQPLPPDPQATT